MCLGRLHFSWIISDFATVCQINFTHPDKRKNKDLKALEGLVFFL